MSEGVHAWFHGVAIGGSGVRGGGVVGVLVGGGGGDQRGGGPQDLRGIESQHGNAPVQPAAEYEFVEPGGWIGRAPGEQGWQALPAVSSRERSKIQPVTRWNFLRQLSA